MQVDVWLNLEGSCHALGRLADEPDGTAFQFDSSFLETGLTVAPFAMPLSQKARHLSGNAFQGLPGLVADSLPDAWESHLLELRRRQRHLSMVSPLEHLCRVGSNGMGALEYRPAANDEAFEPDGICLDAIAECIDDILSDRDSGEALALLMPLSGHAGGSRPKIACLVSEDCSRLARGSLVKDDMTPWLIKFRSSYDRRDQGIQEYVASLVAKRAGICMPRTHLFTSKDDAWFGIERFDRSRAGKIHMCTAASLLECDFRLPVLDYSNILMMTARLSSFEDVVEQFRRAVFNYSIGNCDDHAKNFSFLMHADGTWRISPAYDVVTSESMGGEHMTTVGGIGRSLGRSEFFKLASEFGISKSRATAVLDEVADAVSGYDAIAKDFGIRAPKTVCPI